MSTSQTGRWISYPLIAGGALLLFLGAREVIEPVIGQRDAARGFGAASGSRIRRGDAIAKLTIPRLDAALYVVEGDDENDLRLGPGHLRGSAMPGAAGNCVIAGHRDTHFRVLQDIRRGDDIVLQTGTERYVYRVSRTQVVSPENMAPLQPTARAELNLITCFPFSYVGSAPKRFVVEARLIDAVSPTTAGVVE